MPNEAQLTKNQEIYQKLKAKGICPNCKTRPAVTGKVQCARCATLGSAREREKTARLREEIIEAYGGKCICCGENRVEFLTIDHINGRGNRDKPLLIARGAHLYSMLKRASFPKDEFRLLCFNCNQALGRLGYCPHQRDRHNE